MKDLAIGGIVMLENTSGEPETIVEPMVVNKVGLYKLQATFPPR